MMKFTVLVIASVLAPGLHSAIVQTRPDLQISTFPHFFEPETRPEIGAVVPELRPEIEAVAPELRPEIEAVAPELRPEPVPEVEAVVPELISVNPCDSCFEYMTALIDQLTNVDVPVHPQLPEIPEVGLPEPEVVRPLPESVPEDLRPLPVPELPGIGVNPIPIPVDPETGIRPLPLPVQPEVEINPIPFPIAPQTRPSTGLDYIELPQH
ncbi:hypothetical protein NQ315_016622 [Exocentrus adspersus]|uniref:Uncharacterized protein n=1 Tax=Exocentrus adspersus TaxID=1586481 RepID=A0AAV8VNF5_9CUCU|nr:hypothetical protein NQ315_016622 [Exocentrus adspersus]